MSEVVILIPPSEGKSPDGESKPLGKSPKSAQPIIDALIHYKGDWEKLLGVKGKALDKAVSVNRNLLESKTMPAIERYSGVVYDGIDYASLKNTEQSFFNKHVRIISAAFGLVKPDQLIPDYKLKIDKLGADKHWQPIISKELKNSYVIDCLPRAHQKAVGYTDGVFVDFVVEKGGKRKPAGHFGKLIKGKFVRWLCENKVKSVKEFKKFKVDGFQWNGECFLKKG